MADSSAVEIKEEAEGWPYPASCSPDEAKMEAFFTNFKEEVLQEVIQWEDVQVKEEQISFEEPGFHGEGVKNEDPVEVFVKEEEERVEMKDVKDFEEYSQSRTLLELVNRPGFYLTSNVSSTVRSLGKQLEELTGCSYPDTSFLYSPALKLVELFKKRKNNHAKFIRSPSAISWMGSIKIQAPGGDQQQPGVGAEELQQQPGVGAEGLHDPLAAAPYQCREGGRTFRHEGFFTRHKVDHDPRNSENRKTRRIHSRSPLLPSPLPGILHPPDVQGLWQRGQGPGAPE